MSTVLKLPDPKQVASFLEELLGPSIGCEECSEQGFHCYAFAEYFNDEDKRYGIVACDLESSARLSASLTRIPKGVSEDGIQSGSLPEHILENLGEIFNIASNLFPDSHRHRITLNKSYFGEEAANQFAALEDVNLCAFQLEILSYGSGKICIAKNAASEGSV